MARSSTFALAIFSMLLCGGPASQLVYKRAK